MPISHAQSSPFNSFIGITKQILAASLLNGIGVDSKTIVSQTKLQQLNNALPIDMPNCIAYTKKNKIALDKIKTQIQQIEVHNTTVDCLLNLDYSVTPKSLITLSKDNKDTHILFGVDTYKNNYEGLHNIQKEVLKNIKKLPGCEDLSNTTALKDDHRILSELNTTSSIITASGDGAFDSSARQCATSMLQSAKSAHITRPGVIAFPVCAVFACFVVAAVQMVTAEPHCDDGTIADVEKRNAHMNKRFQETSGYSKTQALAVASIIALKNILQASTAATIGGAVANGICTVEGMRGTADTTGYSEKNMYLASLLGSSLLSIPPALHLARQLTLQTQDNNKRCQYKNNDAAHNTNMLTFPITHITGAFLGQTIMTANTIDSAAAKKTAVAAALGFLIFSVGSEVALNLILKNRNLPEPRQKPEPVSAASQNLASNDSEASSSVISGQVGEVIVPIPDSDDSLHDSHHASTSQPTSEIEMQRMQAPKFNGSMARTF